MRNASRVIVLVFAFVAASPRGALAGSAAAPKGDTAAPLALVDDALKFLRRYALDAPDEATLLQAGVLRLCTEKMNRPGCRRPGLEGSEGPGEGIDRARAWRAVLGSVIAAASKGGDSDTVAFERYVIDAMVGALNDAQSFYIAPAVYRKITTIPSEFIGFGFAPVSETAGLRVAVVYENSPAYGAGLRSGDLIIAVNGQSVSGYRRPMALAAIWGADGERLELTVRRPGGKTDLELVYRPWTFNPYSVTVQDGVAVARISHLTDGLEDAVARAISQPKVRGLVIDLTDAVTGSQSSSLGLGDLLLPEGDFGRRRSADDLTQRQWRTQNASTGENVTLPIIVILSENTAGWAELLAGALKHRERALIIGGKSAGRPKMQLIRPFDDGSAVQVTSAELCGPPGVDLSSGVRPHVEFSSPDPLAMARAVFAKTGDAKVSSLLAAARALISAPEKQPLDSDR